MTNRDYKNAALAALRGNWSRAVIATVVYLLAGVAIAAIPSRNGSMYSSIVTLVLDYFLLIPLAVGIANAFRILFENSDANVTGNMFHLAFRGNYLHVVAGMTLLSIVLVIGYLLFIIPGIIWTFAYSMTPFILVENPELSIVDAMKKSRLVMKGHKFDLFYLELSFIGWVFLSVLTLGIGIIWLQPYMATSLAAFWDDLKA